MTRSRAGLGVGGTDWRSGGVAPPPWEIVPAAWARGERGLSATITLNNTYRRHAPSWALLAFLIRKDHFQIGTTFGSGPPPGARGVGSGAAGRGRAVDAPWTRRGRGSY